MNSTRNMMENNLNNNLIKNSSIDNNSNNDNFSYEEEEIKVIEKNEITYTRGRKYNTNSVNRIDKKNKYKRTKNYVDAPRRVKVDYVNESSYVDNEINSKNNNTDESYVKVIQKYPQCQNKNCKSISTYTRNTSNSLSNKSDIKSNNSINKNNVKNNCCCCSNAQYTSEDDNDNTLSNEIYKILCDVYSAHINNKDIKELIRVCYASVCDFCLKEEQNEILMFVKIFFDN